MRFSESLILNDDGTRASATETQMQTDGSIVTLNYAWGYDRDGRLKSESLSSSKSALNYSDSYSFDLNGNIVTDVHTGAGGTVGTTTNTYNGDGQLI
jgi:hypothetical protein